MRKGVRSPIGQASESDGSAVGKNSGLNSKTEEKQLHVLKKIDVVAAHFERVAGDVCISGEQRANHVLLCCEACGEGFVG